MSVPERYWRFPTEAAIEALAARFGLRAEPWMLGDWEHLVGDPGRIGEFLAALEADDLSDDERFALSEVVMQSFEDGDDARDVSAMPEWQRFVSLLRARPKLHAFTLCYWSAPDPTLAWFRVSPLVRPLWIELEPEVVREMGR